MKKMQSLFVRDWANKRAISREVTPGCEWVLAGEGIATRKWDGTACMVRGGVVHKRFDAKVDKVTLQPLKPVPAGFEPCQEPDAMTGHWPGWVPIGDGPEDRWHREGLLFRNTDLEKVLEDGTYELCGPKIGSNHERLDSHVYIRHGEDLLDVRRNFDAIRSFLSNTLVEGIVWHHPDGRMVKITRVAFGFDWPVK